MSKDLKERKAKLQKENKAKANAQEIEKINAIQKELVTEEGRYMQPMLIDQLRYLSAMLGRADQRPGKDAYDRYEELRNIYLSLEPKTKALEAGD